MSRLAFIRAYFDKKCDSYQVSWANFARVFTRTTPLRENRSTTEWSAVKPGYSAPSVFFEIDRKPHEKTFDIPSIEAKARIKLWDYQLRITWLATLFMCVFWLYSMLDFGVICEKFYKSTNSIWYKCGSRGGGQGVRTPLENHKSYGFL